MKDYTNCEHGRSRPAPLTYSEILASPAPKWLIDGYVPENRLIMMFGEPDIGKSFVALDMGLSIATESNWQGLSTLAGSVLFLCYEGYDDLHPRLLAWEKEHNKRPNDEDVRSDESLWRLDREREAEALCGHIMEHFANGIPKLVVIDSLRRYAAGADHKSDNEMAQFVNNLNLIRELGTTVLVIHHDTKSNKKDPAGAQALISGFDTIIRLQGNAEKAAAPLTFHVYKQKGGGKNRDLKLYKHVVDLGDDASSLVIRSTNDDRDTVNGTMRRVLSIFENGYGYSVNDLYETYNDKHTKDRRGRNSMQKHANDLVKRGLLCKKREGKKDVFYRAREGSQL